VQRAPAPGRVFIGPSFQLSKPLLIRSNRAYEDAAFWHIVHEWEDDLARLTGGRIETASADSGSLRKMLRRRGWNTLGRLKPRVVPRTLNTLVHPLAACQGNFGFCMNAAELEENLRLPSAIAMVIDFWGHTSLDHFENQFWNCSCIGISNLDAYLRLRGKTRLPVAHWPVVLPSATASRLRKIRRPWNERSVDILFAGRQNPVFKSWLFDGDMDISDINIVWQERLNGKNVYRSNQTPELIPTTPRDVYLELLANSKIALYSTPGIDGGEHRTGGANPITPRYLELLAAGCQIISRYSDSSDADYFKVNHFTHRVFNFREFRDKVKSLLENQQCNQAGPVSEFLELNAFQASHPAVQYIRSVI